MFVFRKDFYKNFHQRPLLDVEFFLSAVIYVNKNEILNDDQYQYYELGLPFLAKLGKIIYNYELKREKAISPDFSRYLHKY